MIFSWEQKQTDYKEALDYFKFMTEADEKVRWLEEMRFKIEDQMGKGNVIFSTHYTERQNYIFLYIKVITESLIKE